MRKDKMIGLFLMPFLASGLVGCQQNDDFSVDVTTYDSTGKVIASTDSTEADETLDIDYYGFAEPVQIGVVYEVEVGEEGGHGFNVGFGTSVEGWLERADKFFESLQE